MSTICLSTHVYNIMRNLFSPAEHLVSPACLNIIHWDAAAHKAQVTCVLIPLGARAF